MDGTFELAEHGADLVITVSGSGEIACLDAALHGFAAHVAEPAPSSTCHLVPVEVSGGPPALLVGLVDEAIALLDIEGALACGLAHAALAAEGLHGWLRTCALDGLRLRGAPPKAATWHGTELAAREGRWHGRVILDL